MREKPRTLGELRRQGYEVITVKQELRRNLVRKMKAGDTLFPGIIGYGDTVVPKLQNAILSGQDLIFLGERGQAKSRLLRSLADLLNEEVPAIAGCEINDNPFAPVCKACRERVAQDGDDTEVSWLPRERRYGEKLATPDITMADLIGEVDPIRVAEGRYLADELTIHYGLIPRTNRGIFCINELPDLPERIQVGLFNIMEERDLQVRGYTVRLPLDIYIVASANPEDYTNRGRIITPLKDRYGAEIRTHYPRTLGDEIAIMELESTHVDEGGHSLTVPQYMKEIVAEFTTLARTSPDVNQRSGVSVRVSIANYETLMANALRRGIRLEEREVAPRISDLPYLVSSTTGKIELETAEEDKVEKLVEGLTRRAVSNVFGRYFKLESLGPLVSQFEEGLTIETSEDMPAKEYVELVSFIPALREAVKVIQGEENPATVASAVEFVLEGLHLNRRLNKDRVTGKIRYRG
ncbi:MAG: sigma 54-interacting transcriptional regulator [Chloroflexi bacterium]|nr:sigma 54-interacting transcriptional regulator [Chloroflexota bacterium]